MAHIRHIQLMIYYIFSITIIFEMSYFFNMLTSKIDTQKVIDSYSKRNLANFITVTESGSRKLNVIDFLNSAEGEKFISELKANRKLIIKEK